MSKIEQGKREMTEMKRELFCSEKMLEQFDKELKIKSKNEKELNILTVKNGIICPLELSETKERENKQFGGVCDENLKFVKESLQQSFKADRKTPSVDWYTGANPSLKAENIKYIDENIVFIGPIKWHFAHFYLESLSRMWFFLNENNLKYKVAYLTQEGDAPNRELMKEAFTSLGLDMGNFIEILEPTKFKSVIIPEQSFVLNYCYHQKYTQIIDKIKSDIPAKKYKKVYFSKKFNYVGSNRTIGDDMAEELFIKNGYKVFYPDKMNLKEMISVLKGCDEFVASSGSNAHNAIFLNDGAKTVILNRSEHFHPTQTMFDEIRHLNSIYIDSFYPILPVDWSVGPFSFCYTEYLEQYLEKYKMRYRRRKMGLKSTQNLIIFIKAWAWFYSGAEFSKYLPVEKIDARTLIKNINELGIRISK